MVQGAVYDAVNSIDGGHQPYLAGLPAASPSASQGGCRCHRRAPRARRTRNRARAGVASAGPRATRRPLCRRARRHSRRSPRRRMGLRPGPPRPQQCSRRERTTADTCRSRSRSATDAGEWRPTPPAGVNDPIAWVANVEPFLLRSSSQFRTNGPRALTSGAYTREYNEVKELGGPTLGSPRTAEQEAVAQFYTVNAVELFNRTFRTISEDRRADPRRGSTALRDAEHGRGRQRDQLLG